MKWIFLFIALSMATLILGTRLYQSYEQKRASAFASAERLARLLDAYNLDYTRDIIREELGPYWRQCLDGEDAQLSFTSSGTVYNYVLAPEAIYTDMVEEECYLILVGVLGLIVAVELAVLLSYILTRPLRRLTLMCREIAHGKRARVPHTFFSPSEFAELTNSFNDMSAQLERWREVQRQLSRMDRLAALGSMLSGLSHEIRNPLASMRIQTDLLRDGIERIASGSFSDMDVHDAEEQIKVLGDEMDRLNNIVARLLSFVKARPVIVAPTKLNDLLQWASAMIGPQAQKNGVEMILKSTEEDIYVMADGESLRQIVMNLALNAIQAMAKNGGSLTISVSRLCDAEVVEYGVITVADTGGGVPQEIEHRIFDPFFTTTKEGTGLGLSIVQRITESLGGKLSHENCDGGATFRIYLKIVERGTEE